MKRKEFDRIKRTSQKLREIFNRDISNGNALKMLSGMEAYIVRAVEEAQTMTPDIEMCDCGCCHYPDLGACPTFEQGMNGRCVYCDHGEECHPGKGNNFNRPLPRKQVV